MQRLEFVSKPGAAPQRPNWIKDSTWRLCQHLEAVLPVFSGICQSIRNNHEQWDAFKASADVYNMMMNPWTSAPASDSVDNNTTVSDIGREVGSDTGKVELTHSLNGCRFFSRSLYSCDLYI